MPVHGEMRHMAEQARLALGARHAACGRPEERRRDPPRARRAEEGRRGARRAAGARRRRDPARRRRDDQRAPPDRLRRPDHGRASRSATTASSPASRWSVRSAFRSRRTATISSPMRPTPRPAPSAPACDEDEAARSGPPRRAPLRDRVDGQEAGRRGHAAPARRHEAARRSSRSTSCSSPAARSSCCRSACGPTRKRAATWSAARPKRAAPVRYQAPFAEGGDPRRAPVRALLRELGHTAGSPPTTSTSIAARQSSGACRSPGRARRRACPCPTTSR